MSKVGSPLVNWALRAFQALFGLVILGLSVTLIRGHHWGSLPSSAGYGAFAGGITILAALVGVAATWLEFLDGIIGLAMDGLVAVLNIAGGIFLAIKLKGITCKDNGDPANANRLIRNDLLNGGNRRDGKDFLGWVIWQYQDNEQKASDIILGHCREGQAAMVFMFMAAVLLLASGLMGFLKRRKGF